MAKETKPLYDEQGRLTRAGMEAAIGSGGSFTYKGRIISSYEGIPSPEELAQTPEEKAAAANDIDAQIAALQARKASLATKPDTSADEADAKAARHASHAKK